MLPSTFSLTSRTLDVGTLINDHPVSAFQIRVLILCFLLVLFDGFDTAAMGYIAPAIIRDWGIAKNLLGPVMSAALFGLAAGALVAGPLADRLGRKKVLLAATFTFGGFSLACAGAGDLDTLAILRFFTGLGLGAAMPCAVSIMAEYSPARRRSLLVSLMFCGFPLGAALGGLVTSWLLPHTTWRSILLLGGIAPLLLLPALALALPESLRFLLLQGAARERIALLLTQALPRFELRSNDRLVAGTADPSPGQPGLGVVLSAPYRFGSLMLWISYFMGLLIFYLLTNWLPLLVSESGMSLERAALLTALFPLGGLLGTLTTGWLMDRFDHHRVLGLTYLLTALLIFYIGQLTAHPEWLAVAICLAGITMNGAQASMPSFAAAYYPTRGRATGVAWMLGIGRFGGITGALLGAYFLQFKLDTFFALLALPAMVAATALGLKRWAGNRLTGLTTP